MRRAYNNPCHCLAPTSLRRLRYLPEGAISHVHSNLEIIFRCWDVNGSWGLQYALWGGGDTTGNIRRAWHQRQVYIRQLWRADSERARVK